MTLDDQIDATAERLYAEGLVGSGKSREIRNYRRAIREGIRIAVERMDEACAVYYGDTRRMVAGELVKTIRAGVAAAGCHR